MALDFNALKEPEFYGSSATGARVWAVVSLLLFLLAVTGGIVVIVQGADKENRLKPGTSSPEQPERAEPLQPKPSPPNQAPESVPGPGAPVQPQKAASGNVSDTALPPMFGPISVLGSSVLIFFRFGCFGYQ